MKNKKILIKTILKKSGATDSSPSRQMDAIIRAANDKRNQKIALKKIFEPNIKSWSADDAADRIAHLLRDMSTFTQIRTVLNGITLDHNTAGALGSTGRVRTYAAGNIIFQGIPGIDRHGVVERTPPVGAMRHNGAVWLHEIEELPRLNQLIRTVKRLDGTTEKIPIDRSNWTIEPATRALIMQFLSSYYPKTDDRDDVLNNIANKLQTSAATDQEIVDVMSKAVLNKNRQDADAIWGNLASANAKDLIEKHFLSPHFYLYDHKEAYPDGVSGSVYAKPIEEFKHTIFRLNPDLNDRTTTKRRIITVVPGGTYATPAGIPQQRWQSLFSSVRPANSISHRRSNSTQSNAPEIKGTIASSYSPFIFNPTPQKDYDIDRDWTRDLRNARIVKRRGRWDSALALEMAGTIYRRSRKKYAERVLDDTFQDISRHMGFWNDAGIAFNPYSRYITGAGLLGGAPLGPLTILEKTARIINSSTGTAATPEISSVFRTTIYPTVKRSYSENPSSETLSWLHMDPYSVEDDKSGTGLRVLKIPSGLSFFDTQSYRAKMDLSPNMTLSSSRGSAYTWRQTNIAHDQEAGDEHALILDCLRALHESGYDYREVLNNDVMFNLIHKVLVKFRSSSGPSSRHKMINFIDEFQNIDRKKAKKMDLGLDIDGIQLSGLDMLKMAIKKRKDYLDAVLAWKEKNDGKASIEKSPLPQQENTLYHHLITLHHESLNPIAIEDPDVGIRIPKTLLDYEKHISRALSVDSSELFDKKNTPKKMWYAKIVYPFLRDVFRNSSFGAMTIPGTGLPIPDRYDPARPTDWGILEAERRRNMDLVFHLFHQIIKATVGNEVCHWCEGTGIIKQDDSSSSGNRYCMHCNVHDPENQRQLLAPESEEDKKAAATGVVPVWDHVHVGTYHNGNTASQITPRFITNYLIMLHHSSSDMKDLLAHPTVIEAVKKIMQNPELYHPRESVGDPEHFSEGLETSAAEQELPAEAPESPPPSMPKMTEPISRVRPAGLSGARPSSSTGGASVPPSTTPPTRPTPPVEDLEDFRASLHEHLL